MFCSPLDSIMSFFYEDLDIMSIPVIGNVFDAVLQFFWHLLGCCQVG